MSEIEKRVIKGFNIYKAVKNKLKDLSKCELIYIILFFAEQLYRHKQSIEDIKDIACDGYNNGQTSYATFQCEKIINIINEVNNANSK